MMDIAKEYSFENAIRPTVEMAAYETLWLEERASFKQIADLFRAYPGALPSDLVRDKRLIQQTWEQLNSLFKERDFSIPGIRIHGSLEYPLKLRAAKNPLEVFYYLGDWDLAYSPSVAIVGARKASKDGIRRVRKLAAQLVTDGFTIVSGLAAGVDQAAHETALEEGGKTIAVLGTPLLDSYPKENAELQQHIARDHLVVSQVPFLYHSKIKDLRERSSFFPERNITMSALTQATVIVEASDTSGTLYQARAAISQGRKLFIMDNCFKRNDLKWPSKYLDKGAIRISNYEDMVKHLELPSKTDDNLSPY